MDADKPDRHEASPGLSPSDREVQWDQVWRMRQQIRRSTEFCQQLQGGPGDAGQRSICQKTYLFQITAEGGESR